MADCVLINDVVVPIRDCGMVDDVTYRPLLNIDRVSRSNEVQTDQCSVTECEVM